MEDSRAGGTALTVAVVLPVLPVDCTHQAALPPVCVADDHLPCALQHGKMFFFSLKEHSRVRLSKDNVASGKLDVVSL